MFVMPELKTKQVEAFGQTVAVSEMGALDRIEFVEYQKQLSEEGVSETKTGVLLGAFLMVKCVVDENGQRAFEGQSVESVAAKINDMESLNVFFNAAAEINGLLKGQQVAEAKN